MITLPVLKEWLGIELAETELDDLLTELDARAVAYIERRTGRYFGPVVSYTEVLRGNDRRNLWVREPPASGPSEVTATRYPGDASPLTITAADTDGFIVRTVDNEAQIIRKGGYRWTSGYEYQATYDRGYAAGLEPLEIRQLVLDLVKLKFDQRETKTGAAESVSIGGFSYRSGDFTKEDIAVIPLAEETLQLWRRYF